MNTTATTPIPRPRPDTDTTVCTTTHTTSTGTWTCTLTGPHPVTPDGRTRHYFRKTTHQDTPTTPTPFPNTP